MDTFSILIAGVGGQGSLLASRIIGGAAINRGCDVKVSEVHGMSQRGGSVVTYVRFAPGRVYSPIIDRGRADALVAFEQLEAYRYIEYLKNGGVMLLNTQRIDPMPVITGAAEYPADIPEKIKGIAGGGVKLLSVDAQSAAVKAGSVKTVNVVMTGLLARVLDGAGFEKTHWLDALRQSVPPKLLAVNEAAFEAGYAAGE